MPTTRAFVELDTAAYERLATALEREPELSAQLGVQICATCGDLHSTDRLCASLCALLGGGDAGTAAEVAR